MTPGGKARPFYNPTPGADGLGSERKVVNFIENHDGLNRFRVQGISERRNLLADALMLLSPGIPCLYYGTEAGLQDTKGTVGPDAETGRLTFVRAGEGKDFAALEKGGSFQGIAALCALRRELPALTEGEVSPLSAGDDASGLFAFARGGGDIDPVVVIINASDRERTVNALKLISVEGKRLLTPADQLARVPISGVDQKTEPPANPSVQWQEGVPQFSSRVGPESVTVYRVTHLTRE